MALLHACKSQHHHVNTNHVILKPLTRCCLLCSLMTNEGSLLAFAAEHGRSAKTIAAIAANIWSTYKQQSEQNNNLRNIIVECEEGVVYVTNIGAMLLCLAGNTSVELGLLKAKVRRKKNITTVKIGAI